MARNFSCAITMIAVALASLAPCQAGEATWTDSVELDLKSALYSVNVVPKNCQPDALLCDIAVQGSDVALVDKTNGEVLIKDGHMIKGDIKPDETFELTFNDYASNAEIGVRGKFVKRAKSVTLELRPSIWETALIKQRRHLERRIADAEAAKANLPRMRQELVNLPGTLLWKYNRAAAVAKNAQDPFVRARAGREAFLLGRQITNLQKQIAKAQQAIAGQPAAAASLNELQALGNYAEQFASQAHLHVRIHDGHQTLPAQKKRTRQAQLARNP